MTTAGFNYQTGGFVWFWVEPLFVFLREDRGEKEVMPKAEARTSGISQSFKVWASVYWKTIGHKWTRCNKRTFESYILATNRTCPTKILLCSCRVKSLSNTLKSGRWKKGSAKQGVEFHAARVFLRVIPLHKASTTAFCSDGLLAISVLVE